MDNKLDGNFKPLSKANKTYSGCDTWCGRPHDFIDEQRCNEELILSEWSQWSACLGSQRKVRFKWASNIQTISQRVLQLNARQKHAIRISFVSGIKNCGLLLRPVQQRQPLQRHQQPRRQLHNLQLLHRYGFRFWQKFWLLFLSSRQISKFIPFREA